MRISRAQWEGENPVAFAAELRSLTAAPAGVSEEVAAIVERVRWEGDGALLALTRQHDAARMERNQLAVSPKEIHGAAELVDPSVLDALRVAAENVKAVAEAQLDMAPTHVDLPQGQTVTIREQPVPSVGIYVPGGRAAYPSSALMCCIPALVAGVGRVAVVTPPGPDGRVPAVVLAACAIAEADEVYAMGGAHAVAALALGTETVTPVDLIAGPGSRYVQEAKRQVAGRVGIDAPAGPSELMVVLDRGQDPERIALDLCAQAEHGPDGLLVAASADSGSLDDLEGKVRMLASERPSVADAPLAMVEVAGTETALALADALAPEHLQLMFEGADMARGSVRTAGCVFVGPAGGTAFGDYVAGANHVLPTGGAGRFAGPLGPATFRRKMSIVELPGSAAAELAPHVEALADAEGFPVHGESARARARG